MHASTSRVELITDRPKAFSPIHRANSSSPTTFLNFDMTLYMSDGFWRQMAQRRILYRSPRIWPGQSMPYLPSCKGTLPNACPLWRRWHLGQLSGDRGMELRQSELGCWRTPKSWGETHLRVSQSQVAESWDSEARSRLPTLKRGRGSSWEPRD
jgi:hypothetical protein